MYSGGNFWDFVGVSGDFCGILRVYWGFLGLFQGVFWGFLGGTLGIFGVFQGGFLGILGVFQGEFSGDFFWGGYSRAHKYSRKFA